MVRKRFFNLVVLAAAVVRRRCRKRFGPRTATGLFAVADRTGRSTNHLAEWSNWPG